MRLFRSISSSKREYRRGASRAQRGQSLVEVALLLFPLLMMAGVVGDGARMFFISQSVTNAAREGALFATQHGMEGTWANQTQLTNAIEKVMGGEDQGSNAAYHCPSWPASPAAAPDTTGQAAPNGGVQVTYLPDGVIPLAPGATVTITIKAGCNVNPVLSSAFWPLPNPVKLLTQIQAQTLAPQ